MNTYRTTSPRVLRGRAVALALGLALVGSVWAPKALATPLVPEPGRTDQVAVRHLSVAELRHEAAADRAQHLRWMGGTDR